MGAFDSSTAANIFLSDTTAEFLVYVAPQMWQPIAQVHSTPSPFTENQARSQDLAVATLHH